jgi:signal transduction histidine kinase
MGGPIESGVRTVAGVHSPEDRRRRSPRAIDRRRAAEDALLDALLLPEGPVREGVGVGGQTLLTAALRRLERQPGVAAAVAWSIGGDGAPKILGAQPGEAAGRIKPTREVYDALTRLEHVQRLTDGGLGMELTALAVRGVSAVAPVAGLGTGAAAILLLFAEKQGRPLRPRTIAVLGEVAAKLSRSMSTSLALDRLGQLDAAVERLDRLASLGDLVSEIVHEIRNPLVSIKTFLQLLPDRLDDPEFHQDFRLVVSDELARLERMLDNLLRHARPGAPREDDFGGRVSEAVETTLQLMTPRCRERGIELDALIRPDLPALRLSEDALRQLLLNLLVNAAEVTPKGGHIALHADWSEHVMNHLEVRVEDDGPGIDPRLAARLFEPFWTSRSDRVGGLGLAICKRIVEATGGSIAVENRREGGACFRVELPIAS